MIPHPFKTDTWIEGERTGDVNHCLEIDLGIGGECTLGKPDSSKLTSNHLTQIKAELWRRGGGPEGKINPPFYAGATPDQLLPKEEVDAYADQFIWFYGDATKSSQQIEYIQIQRNIARQDRRRQEQTSYDLFDPKKSTMEVFNEASLDWKIQIYNEVNYRTGQPRPYPVPAKKIGALPQVTVEEFADIVIQDNDNNPDTAEIVLKASILEYVYLMSGMAMNSTLKEKNLMQSMTRVTDEIIAAVNHGEQEGALAKLSLAGDEYGKFPDGGFKRGELPLVSASTTGKSVADFDGDSIRRVKRKKSKPKSNHLPNMRNSTVKSALGASILGMLGKVQRQHTDAAKHQLLQELPLADLVEVAGGKKLPAYQANLLNTMQAKADPNAPVVRRFVEETKKTSQTGIGTYYAEAISDDAPAIPELQALVDVGSHVTKVAEQLLQDSYSKLPQVSTIGEVTKDIRVTYKQFSNIFHNERFVEETADLLEVSIATVTAFTDQPDFYVGLVAELTKKVEADIEGLFSSFAEDGVWSIIESFIVGYTKGYVEPFITKSA